MSENRDIEEKFRESAPLWDESPPDSAWDRLSDKLDAGHSARRLRDFRRWGFAASLFVVAVAIGFWSLSGSKEIDSGTRSTTEFAMNGSMQSEQQKNDIEPSGTGKTDSELANGNVQGLISSDSVIITNGISRDLAESNGTLELNSQFASGAFQKSPHFDPLGMVANKEIKAYADSTISLAVSGNSYLNLSSGTQADSVKSWSANDLQAMSMLNTVGRQDPRANQTYSWETSDSTPTSLYNSSPWLSYQQATELNQESISQLNASENYLGYTSLDSVTLKDNSISIQNFNWLLGNWEGDAPNGDSYEEWIKEDEHTIVGNGFFQINGDTLLTEEMKIKQEGESIYLITAIDSGKKPVRFRLRSVNGEVAIFENPAVDFPNEIIVEQHSDNNYSTIMKNGKVKNMRSAQRSYLNKRNNIYYNNEVIRNLKRSN